MLLVCAAVFLASCKEQKADLRFVPGKSANYEMVFDIASGGLNNGRKTDYKQGATLLLQMTEDSGRTNVNATYKRFWANFHTIGDSMKVDTDKPQTWDLKNDAQAMPAIYQAVKDESFSFRINTLGKIEAMPPFTPMLTSITRKVLPAEHADNIKAYSQIYDIASGFFSPGSMKMLLVPVFQEFPGKELKVGDTLGRNYQIEDGLPITIVQVVKVAEITDEAVTLLIGGSGFSSASIESDLKLEQQGRLTVNRKTGVMQLAYIENIVKGKLGDVDLDSRMIINATCKKLP
ncbi:hypothetical protein HHL16_18265 [Pseudoflavitalea sp. G-6-1-2]|uniref:DUF6263 family protein n=1 Tax=Pseudoflavitalea sp. G-6-1-2 TaxID=2728841 RepID=UPI00146EA814|nr:DUF6263 family protein [Pseudoflavitalea sp. G-6-1-2]NML22836.1 hypothetical protein [Pseudoflavitalea sp. G-6-1-2]